MTVSKQSVGAERKYALDVEEMEDFRDGMTLFTGSEKVAEENVTRKIGSEQ